jgi:hypothetical protein
MSKALVLGVATLALSAGAALAQAPNQYVYPNSGYAPFGLGYVPSAPLYNYAAPAYSGPAYGFSGPAYSGPAYGYSGPAYETGDQPPLSGGYGRHHKRLQTGQQLPRQPQY